MAAATIHAHQQRADGGARHHSRVRHSLVTRSSRFEAEPNPDQISDHRQPSAPWSCPPSRKFKRRKGRESSTPRRLFEDAEDQIASCHRLGTAAMKATRRCARLLRLRPIAGLTSSSRDAIGITMGLVTPRIRSVTLSFLACICCGFGAIILFLVLTASVPSSRAMKRTEAADSICKPSVGVARRDSRFSTAS